KVSDDGKMLVFTEEGDGGGPDYSVFLRPTDGRPAVKLGTGFGTALSPDGKWGLSVRINPAPSPYVLLPTGAGACHVLTHDDLSHELGSWVLGGSRIAFEGFAPGRPKRIYLQDLQGGAAQPITPEGVVGPISDDAKLVASEGRIYEVGGRG